MHGLIANGVFSDQRTFDTMIRPELRIGLKPAGSDDAPMHIALTVENGLPVIADQIGAIDEEPVPRLTGDMNLDPVIG